MGAHRGSRVSKQMESKRAVSVKTVERTGPPLPDNVGRTTKWKNIRGELRTFTISDEIRRLQSGNPHKLICLQRLWCNENQREEFRLGYYMIGVRPRMSGKWTWGQFATIIPATDFRAIIKQAQKRGWF